jgi:hypothetical protein
MDSTWSQLALGLVAVAAAFGAVAAGVLLLAWTPVRRASSGAVRRARRTPWPVLRRWAGAVRGAVRRPGR